MKRHPQNQCFDFDRRISNHGEDKLAGLEWTYELVSQDGAHYHCWIPIGLGVEDRNSLLGKFQSAAYMKGDPVGFSWDYLPEPISSYCDCADASDVFNGVCGKCLMPTDNSPRAENGMLI